MSLKNKKYLCIHSHFYQPPRENAWTGEIETQPTAAPFHDWNERIFQECYKPNTEAIIVDEHDNVINRVNNYEHYSFNFGPSLLHWIKKKHEKTYHKIIEADKISREKLGHGNAIAQVYNHMIMPLANERDKVTMVKWGLADFRFHFGRDSEGMWLPETACNEDTLEVLIGEGIKFSILDPSQAEKFKKITKKRTGKWDDVSDGSIDPKRAYRYFSKTAEGKFIDIFFYDGALSKNIAFDDHVYTAQKMLDRIKRGEDPHYKKEQLVSVAVDGETFGHHKRFTERTIAYLMTELLNQKDSAEDLIVTNFASYLADHTPEYEVKIKTGEGTSWSCLHGVGRWKENCGCNTGMNAGWDQQWRKVLRESLDWLRDELAEIYEREGSEVLKDVWNARNDYIWLILDDSEKSHNDFFYFHAKKYLQKNETEKCIRLLEMQKFAMLMFTSCGWFFDDISGIETIQILQYASRAMEIASAITGKNLETEFLSRLSEAKSNVSDYSDGKDTYLKEVKRKKIMDTTEDQLYS